MQEIFQRKQKFVTLKNSRFKLAMDFKNGGRKYFPSKDYVTYENKRDEVEGLSKLYNYIHKTKGLWTKCTIYMCDNLPNDFGAVPSERPNYHIKVHERNENGLDWTKHGLSFKYLDNNDVICILRPR
jgi:hypothetical protein